MFSTKTTTRAAMMALGIGAMSLLSAAGGARGQCSIYRLDIPDLDQRRTIGINTAGLPGGGSTYCVPTSCLNWLAYIGTHGYPEVLAPRNWQNNGAPYGAATELLRDLGDQMGTSSGTDPVVGSEVTQTWLDQTSPGNFVSYCVFATGSYAPSTFDIYNLMNAGDLVSFGTARWVLTGPSGPPFNLPQRYVRSSGGHAMTISRVVNACGPAPVIWIRDPADPNDGATVSQSVFRSKFVDIVPTFGLFADTAISPVLFPRLVYRGIDPNNTAKFSVVHTLMVIAPKHGLTANAQLGEITGQSMMSSDDLTTLPTHTHTTPNAAPIIAMKMHPHFPKGFLLTRVPGQDAQLLAYTPATGAFDSMGPMPGATGLAFGRNGEMYVQKNAAVVVRLDLASGGATETGSVNVAGVGALSYDDTTDTVVCVSPGRRAIGFTSAVRFGVDYAEAAIPAGVVIGGETTCAVSPADGTIWLASAADNAIYSLTKTGPGTLILNQRIPTGGAQAPRNVQVDHRGNVVFTVDGVVREMRRNAASGAMEIDSTSKFAGLIAGDFFEQTPGRSSVDDTKTAAILPQDVPNQSEVEGQTVLDCRPDYDGNGTLDVQDIFGFLNGWFGGNRRTDFNFDGSRDVQDIFDFLNAWFAGC